MINHLTYFTDRKAFLEFLRTRIHLFHKSNLFFRDFHYGVMAYLHKQGFEMSYSATEDVAKKVAALMEREGILAKQDARTWTLNYSGFKTEFQKPVIETKQATKI